MATINDVLFDEEADEVEPTDDELLALEAEEDDDDEEEFEEDDDEGDEPLDDGPEEPPAEVVKGQTEMVAEDDIAERLMGINQTLYTTLKLLQKAPPRVIAGVFTEISEMRRLVSKLPAERPEVRTIGFRIRYE